MTLTILGLASPPATAATGVAGVPADPSSVLLNVTGAVVSHHRRQ